MSLWNNVRSLGLMTVTTSNYFHPAVITTVITGSCLTLLYIQPTNFQSVATPILTNFPKLSSFLAPDLEHNPLLCWCMEPTLSYTPSVLTFPEAGHYWEIPFDIPALDNVRQSRGSLTASIVDCITLRHCVHWTTVRYYLLCMIAHSNIVCTA